MKKQQLLENKQHGTPAFPFECFRTQTDTTDFFIPLHWHKNGVDACTSWHLSVDHWK